MTPRPYRLGRRQAAVDRTRARILTAARALLVARGRSEEHTSELQSRPHLVCRLLLEKKKQKTQPSGRADRLSRRQIQRTKAPATHATRAAAHCSGVLMVQAVRHPRPRMSPAYDAAY